MSRQRGAVMRPELDGRLRANRDNAYRLTATQKVDQRPMSQGRVKNPDADRRLKKNRTAQI